MSALLGGRGFAYARYRLGFLSIRMLLRTGIHALEIAILVGALVPFDFIAPLITYRALSSVAGAAHWGALEVLRTRVRELVGRRQLGAARLQVEGWLGVTLVTCGALVLLTLALEVGTSIALARITLRDAFGLACVLRLTSDSALRVMHAGVFALRRVYRPLWSSLVPDLLELAILAAAFESYGVWALPVAIVAGGSCDAVLSFVFARRAYLQRRLPLPSFARSFRALRTAQLRSAGAHALANVSLQLDGLVLLLLVYAGQSGGAFATVYYVLRPLMAASTQGLRTFYFDLKRVESAGLRAFRPQLLRYLEVLSVGWAMLLAALTLAFARLWYEELPTFELLLLVPLFVVRSAFSLVQLVSFGAGDLGRLFRLAVLVLAGLACLWLLELREVGLLLGVTVLLAAAVAFASLSRALPARAAPAPGLLDPGAWLAWTGACARVQLAVLQVNGATANTGAVSRGLRASHPSAAITRWGERHLLVAHPDREPLQTRTLIVACGGTLARVWVSPADTPRTALAHARHTGVLPEGLAFARARSLDELEREFRERYTEHHGELLALGSGARCRRLSTRAVSPTVLHALARCIRARSHGRRSRAERALPFEVAVFAPGGQAEVLFIADKGATAFEDFRARVQLAGWRASWPWPEAFDLPESCTTGAAAPLTDLR